MTLDDPTMQERLREFAGDYSEYVDTELSPLLTEAADALDARDARIEELEAALAYARNVLSNLKLTTAGVRRDCLRTVRAALGDDQ